MSIEADTLRTNIQQAIKKNNHRYLEGVLQVEKALGKPDRVEWLKKKIKEIKDGLSG